LEKERKEGKEPKEGMKERIKRGNGRKKTTRKGRKEGRKGI
jgi:hypothetical protein